MGNPTDKYYYPPIPGNGGGTFSDDVVGLQIVNGGGLTGGNFSFTSGIFEKVNRSFNIGSFNEPITLNDLNILNEEQNKKLIQDELSIYPNYDITQVLNFSMYGSLSKRFSVSLIKIINFFPASIDVSQYDLNLVSGFTAENIVYNSVDDETYFEVNVDRLYNPFNIDYSVNADLNISYRETEVSKYRNLYGSYLNYCIDINDDIYKILSFTPSESIYSGMLSFYVKGAPFGVSGGNITDSYKIRPNDLVVDRVFKESFDEVEQFLLNRLTTPTYTATFQIPAQNDYGQFYIDYRRVTFPKDGTWNLDIRGTSFDDYISNLQVIAETLDSFKTNLISRFLVSDSLKEFDTLGRKVESLLQIYGRSFDEIKKFIDGIAYMNSVNYTPKNDIPSLLLVNLAKTLGWETNFSIVSSSDLLESIFGDTNDITYPGYARSLTPNELNYNFYRNLIINSAYLFRSKGTRRSIEFLLRLIGTPEPLIEFNEHVYLADQKININDFNAKYANISGGTYVISEPVYRTSDVFKLKGVTYTGFTTGNAYQDVDIQLSDYPISVDGYPSPPANSESFYFQKGAGWYTRTPVHRSPDDVKLEGVTYSGQNFNIQTTLELFTYGDKYLDRFRSFPFMNEGFKLTKVVDNNKSWLDSDNKLRVNKYGDYNAYYYVDDERLVINSKNIDVYINPSLGLVYDVWDSSIKNDYPIASTGLTSPYPILGGNDSTFINPKTKTKTFFEFANTFWRNMINVRNRMYINDGKTGGYPTLESIFWKYIESNDTVGIPNNEYTYQKLIDYVTGLNPYWVNLIEQMVPATTIWHTGFKYENSIFNRQKFTYKRQRGCLINEVDKESEYIITNIFRYDCNTEYAQFYVYPWLNGDNNVSTLSSVLASSINKMKIEKELTGVICDVNSVKSKWYVDLRVSDEILIKYHFYDGYGYTDVPTNNDWLSAVVVGFGGLIDLGYSYEINGDKLTLITTDCVVSELNKKVKFNIGLDLTISCA